MLTSSRGGAKRRREGWATKRTLTRVLVPAARFARVVQTNTLKEAEGAGNAGCALHPRPRVQQKSTRVSNHRYTASTGIPCTMVLTVSFVISPVTGLFCHRHSRNRFRKLSASVGAPGPHDFAVHCNVIRLTR